MSRLSQCKIIDFPKVLNKKGNITYIEEKVQIPFKINRVYYVYDVPGGATRGAHAHKSIQELIIAVNGSFDVILDDGKKEKGFSLNRSFYGLYVPRMIWRKLDNFSTGSVCLVLASEFYNEQEYIRNYNVYKSALMDKK